MRFNEKELKGIRNLADNRDVLIVQGKNSQGIPFTMEGCVYLLIDEDGKPYMPDDGFMFFQGQLNLKNLEMFTRLITHRDSPILDGLFVEKAQLKNSGEIIFENPDVDSMVQSAIAYRKELDKRDDEFLGRYITVKDKKENEELDAIEEWQKELIGKPVIYNYNGLKKGVVLSVNAGGFEITTGSVRHHCSVLEGEIKVDDTVAANLEAYASSDQMI